MIIRSAKSLNNQKRGKHWEQEFIQYLARCGFWAHFMHPAPDGSQPFDIIAIFEGKVSAYDCKTLKGRRFPLNRIEDNQRVAFELLNKQGVTDTYFVIRREEDSNRIYLISSAYLTQLKDSGVKSIDIEEDENVINYCFK